MGVERPTGTDTRAESPPADAHPPAPPPDESGSPGRPSRLESLRAAREAQQAGRTERAAEQTEAQATDSEQGEESTTTEWREERSDSQDRDTPPLPRQDDQEPDPPDGEVENDTSSDEPAGAPTGQSGESPGAQLPAEGPDRPTDGPRPENAPLIRVSWPPETDAAPTRWSSPVVQFNDQSTGAHVESRGRNGQGLAETPDATDDEPNKYRELPDLSRDGTPGRGDPIPPEDDPADRNPDPEESRRSRWEPYDRVNSGIEGVKKAAEGAKGYVEKPPPTGQAEVKTDTGQERPQINKANPTDVVLGGVILSAAILGTLMKTKDKINSRRNQHEDN